MTFLIILLAMVCAFFAASLDKEMMLTRDIKPQYPVNLVWISVAVPAYYFFNHYWYFWPLLIFGGLFFITVSLGYLEVINSKIGAHHAGLNMLLIVILAAAARMDWFTCLYIIVFYYAIYLISVYFYKKLFRETNEQILQMLELSRILNGILILIIGLVLATNSILFLEKLVLLLF